VDFIQQLRHLLHLVDDDRLLQLLRGCREELLPQQKGTLDEFKEKIGLKQVVSQAVREGRPEERGLARLPWSPQESGLPLRQLDLQQPRRRLHRGWHSLLVVLLWSIILLGKPVNIGAGRNTGGYW
jgi:hypothetical protein